MLQKYRTDLTASKAKTAEKSARIATVNLVDVPLLYEQFPIP